MEKCDECKKNSCRGDINDNRRAGNSVPKTGDQNNMNLWIMIFSIGLIGLIIVSKAIAMENKKDILKYKRRGGSRDIHQLIN